MSQQLNERFPIAKFTNNVIVRPVPWVIEDFWQLSKINVMFGAEKAGKSRLLNWLLAGMSPGAKVLGMRVENMPKKILYLAGEEQVEEVNGRLLKYAGFNGEEQSEVSMPIEFMPASGMRLELPQQRLWLENLLVSEGFDMIIADPLRRIHGADENDNTAMSHIFNDFRRWTNRLGVTMVLLHHTGKLNDDADYNRIATWGRGATDLAAILDTAQFVQRVRPREVRVMRAGRFRPVDPLLLDDGFDEEFVYRLAGGKYAAGG